MIDPTSGVDRVTALRRAKAEATRAGRMPRHEQVPTCRICRRPDGQHRPGDADAEWQGRARMAAARRQAGLYLDLVDLEALDRHPDALGRTR